MPLSLLFALVAAVLYAVGALLVKRTADLSVGLWRSAFVANVLTALCFQPLLLLGGTFHAALWWQPVATACCFLAGQWLTFRSLEHGDVSVATPVLGIKILLVAVFVTILGGESLRWPIWTAALLATAGIVLLNRSGGSRSRGPVGRTIATAGLAAAAFALFEVLIQLWSPRWGLGRFLPITVGISGVLSFAFIPRFRAPLRELPRASWPWLIASSGTMAVQAVVITSTIAKWGGAAAINVVYSSRGLWSVLLVWLAGHWVMNREQQLGGAVLRWRLAGAALMLSAIVLVVA